MTKYTPSGAKMHRESIEPESHQTAKMFFFLLLLFFFFFFFFRRASSNLRESFTMVFAQNGSIFHWAVHQPIPFFQVWSHTRRFELLAEELWLPYDAIFLHVYACAQITLNFELLATKCNYYARLLNYKYCWCAEVFEESPANTA